MRERLDMIYNHHIQTIGHIGDDFETDSETKLKLKFLTVKLVDLILLYFKYSSVPQMIVVTIVFSLQSLSLHMGSPTEFRTKMNMFKYDNNYALSDPLNDDDGVTDSFF